MSSKAIIAVFTMIALLFLFGCICSSCADKSTGEDRPHPPIISGQEIVDAFGTFSSDGSRIIYFRDFSKRKGESWPWGVFIHSMSDGSDSLIWENFPASYFTWSPDDQYVAFSLGGQIYVAELATGVMTRITQQPENCWAPRWSPCGNRIEYFIREGNDRGLYSYWTVDSTSHFVLSLCTTGDYAANCLELAVIRSGFPPMLLNLADTTSKLLPDLGTTYYYDIAMSPDSSAVLVTTTHNLFSIDLKTREVTSLTTKGGRYPDWSPDAQWIVFTQPDTLNGHLWLMRPDGAERHQITD